VNASNGFIMDIVILTLNFSEAHSLDGWDIPNMNRKSEVEEYDICYKQPKTMEERKNVCNDFITRMNVTMPVLIDSMDNRKINTQYLINPNPYE
jgi:hypothetical protein